MPVNDYALDNLFRDKEQERTPDTGQMQQHWQQMQQLLPATPVQGASKTGQRRLLTWAAGLALAGLLVILAILFTGKNDAVADAPETAAAGKPAPAVTESTYPQPVQQPVTETAFTPAVINRPAVDKPVPQAPMPVKQQAVPDNRADEAAFDAFYIHLSKPPQIFSVSAEADTMITCQEGTKVKLPAGVFVDAQGNKVSGEFSLIVQEYYRYGDIADPKTGKKTSGQRTAGMAKVEAYRGEEKLQIKDGYCIEIQMHPAIDKPRSRPATGNEPAAVQQELSSKTISTLGWISTYGPGGGDHQPKTNLTIRFGSQHNPQQFMSQLAFANAVMPGYIDGQQIVFSNVPVGETVFLVSLGHINNQFLSCIKKIVVGNEAVTDIYFSETSPEKYKQQMELLASLPVKE